MLRGVKKALQESEQIVAGHLAVAQYLRHQARSYRLAPMNRHNRTSPVRMLQEMVAASHTDRFKATSVQCRYDLPPGDPRQSGHPSTQTR
jgi:hypothetical protein